MNQTILVNGFGWGLLVAAVIMLWTERKRQKAMRRAMEEAKAANRAKSEFLANMSHEIRTPLNGVMGMIELLAGTPMVPQQQRYLRIARSSAESLLSLINDILDFSKIEAGKLELEMIDFDLATAIEDVAEILAQRAERKGLELNCHIHAEVPCRVVGDPNRLRQVLMNLLSNAVKFTEKGEVVVRATLEEQSRGHAVVRVEVADTGIGIPAERMERLFQAFSQVDASTTRRYGGTGLGLAISRQLTELMGGKIGADSEFGRGSTFWFTARFAGPDDAGQEDASPGDVRGLRVLVVDDNATNREILRDQLQRWGIEVTCASEGPTALQLLQRAEATDRPYDMAILDMQMPEMDGVQLAEAIHDNEDLRQITLIMLTSMGLQLSEQQRQRLGIRAYLTKPARQSQLFDAIMRLHRRDREQGEPRARRNPSPPAAAASPHSGLSGARVLLAEDNEVNQIVGEEILKKASVHCDIVNDGQQAIEALIREDYDLVLMDCQMPVLDGFEATRQIRRLETDGGLARDHRRRLPIVALTANALKGDRERCLDCGMDEYISKPIDPDELLGTIERLIRAARGPEDPPPASEDAPSSGGGDRAARDRCAEHRDPPIRFDRLLSRCMGNPDLAEKLLRKFEQQARRQLDELEDAARQSDARVLAQVAHALKGSAANLSAERVAEAARHIEELGRSGDPDGQTNGALERLRDELDACLRHIADGPAGAAGRRSRAEDLRELESEA